MRIGYTINTLTSVDVQEIVEIGRKIMERYEGVVYRKSFKISPLRKVIEKLLTVGQNYKDEKIDLMQRLVKVIMNSLYGVQKGKNINETYFCQSDH